MDKGVYTMQALKTKYDQFRSPAFTITIGAKTLASTQFAMLYLEVELCADGSAGGCRFTVGSEYDREKSQWLHDLAKTIEVGAKLEVKGGYGQQEDIFFGYVDEYSVEYGGTAPPRISVSGIDGFGFLMSCQEPVYGGKKKPQQVAKEILSKAYTAGYAKSVTVGTLPDSDVPPIKEQLDDFKYLRMLAERYCMSLLCVKGELILDDVVGYSTPLLTLSAIDDLVSFTKRVSLHGQVGKVTVWGRDVNQKFIQGEASSVSVGGAGKSAAQVASKFTKAARREYCEYVRTEAECKKRAQARLNSLALDFVSGEGCCLGIPELIPGRYVSIKGVDGDTEGSYFVSKVRHRFNSGGGYFSTFEVKGAKS